jgi:beta-galactosidase
MFIALVLVIFSLLVSILNLDGNTVDYLKCGALDGAYSTVDFGPGANVTASFISQRAYSPYGPLV